MDGTPVITSASYDGTSYTISGTLDSTPSADFSLEFFGEDTPQRQGAYYLGTATVTTDSSGHAAFSVTLTPSDPFSGDWITATATGTDDGGWTSEFSYDYSLSGANLPARPSLGSNATINPGSTFTQNGSFTDPDSSAWTAVVDYGDGSSPQTLTLNSDKTFTLSHGYALSGTYELLVSITDDSGNVGSADLFVTVAGPVVEAESDDSATITQGDTFTGTGSFDDPTGSSWTATVDYGDGSGSQPLTLNSDNTFDLSHTYTTSGNYTVQVNVTDDSSLIGSATVPVEVDPAAPVVTLGADAAIQVGGTFTQSGSFSDPYSSSWTATVDYGDGSGPQPLTLNSDHTFSLSHTYSSTGTYEVIVSVTGDSGAAGSGAQFVGVFNAPPVVSPGSSASINAGGTLTQSGSFTGSGSSYTGYVDYGDGSGLQSLTLNSDGTFSLSHLYATAGNYAVAVSVIDDSGAEGDATLSVHVNAAPVVTLGSNVTMNEGMTFSRSGSFTDTDSTSWTATVDYGDGSGQQTLTLNTGQTFGLSHFYADNGNFTITVRMTDNGGTVGVGTLAVAVLNVAPTATFAAMGPFMHGMATSFAFGNQSDPSPTDTTAGFTYSYDWNNDGTFEVSNSTSASQSHTFTSAGTYTVHGRITDKDGGYTDYWVTLTIF